MAVPCREKFALIEWLGENRYSVLPLCNAKDPSRCKSGTSVDFKWFNPKGKKPAKYYKALILMISGWFILSYSVLETIISFYLNLFKALQSQSD